MKTSTVRGLGKGLSALLSEEYSDASARVTPIRPPETEHRSGGLRTDELALERIVSGKFQPRTRFTGEQLAELAASIAKNGVMQPIVVRPHPERPGMYEIIAGERRWRASQQAGLPTIPAIIREMEDQQALELALIENVQRQDLTPIEEAMGYQRLMEEFRYTQEALSTTIGKSRSHVANLLRLLALPDAIKDMLEEGELTMGHARAVLKADDPVEMAREIVRRGLNVRQAEQLMRGGMPATGRKGREGGPNAANENSALATESNVAAEPRGAVSPAGTGVSGAEAFPARAKDPDILALEETLSESLGLAVGIDDHGGQGEIRLKYASLEELDHLLQRLGGI